MVALRRDGLCWRRRLLALGVAATIVVGVGLWSQPAGTQPPMMAPKPRDPSDEFFDQGTIPRLKIELTSAEWKKLEQNNRAYVRCTVRDGDEVYSDVGVHLKGAAGSFRELGDRPALTLNFDRFVVGQRFHGMDKFYLNNSVQDPTYMQEYIAGNLFLSAGVPASRISHARVWLNGRDLGLYVLKEGFDPTFLRRYFANPRGHFYDGGFLREITDPLDIKSGPLPHDHSDLKALAQAAQIGDPAKRWTELDKLLDIDRFVVFLALEVMTCHWDGYAMNRNNYRLYHDPTTGKIVFIPHGMDQMFGDTNLPLYSARPALVAQAVMTTPQGRLKYREKVEWLMERVVKEDVLAKQIDTVHGRIRPVLKEMNEGLASEIDGQAQGLKSRVVERVKNLQRQAAMPPPKPLLFGPDRIAAVAPAWTPRTETDLVLLNDQQKAAARQALVIKTDSTGQGIVSWRTTVLLPPGHYRFEGRVKTAGVVPRQDVKGTGAGLRISGKDRTHQVSGTVDWSNVAFEFDVAGEEEVQLVCELRATRGEAAFDTNSLRLVKLR